MDTKPILVDWGGEELKADAIFTQKPLSNIACMDPRTGTVWARFDIGGKDWKCLYALQGTYKLTVDNAPMAASNSPLALLEKEGVEIVDDWVLLAEFLRMWEILEKLGKLKEC